MVESKRKTFQSTDPVMLLNVQQYLTSNFAKHSDESPEYWDKFYDSYNRIVRRFAGACGMQDTDVDECSQEVWVAVVRGLTRFEHDPARARFRSWLYRIVSNKAADIVRDRTKHSAISLNDSSKGFDLKDSSQSPQLVDLDAAWRNELLREAMNKLKESCRPRDYDIFIQRTLKNQPAATVGEVHKMTDGAVRVVDHRLRKQLQSILNSLTDGQISADFG